MTNPLKSRAPTASQDKEEMHREVSRKETSGGVKRREITMPRRVMLLLERRSRSRSAKARSGVLKLTRLHVPKRISRTTRVMRMTNSNSSESKSTRSMKLPRRTIFLRTEKRIRMRKERRPAPPLGTLNQLRVAKTTQTSVRTRTTRSQT